MKNNDLITICNTFRDKLKQAKIEIKGEIKFDEYVQLNIIPDFLAVYISNDDITVSYDEENDEFWKVTYNTDQTWVDDASKHAIRIATYTTVVDYYYSKFTQELLCYKIWIIGEDNRKKLLKKVTRTVNLFAFFTPKVVTTRVLRRIDK